MTEVNLPVLITEGEFKTLASWRLARHQAAVARFLPIGLPGVWNFRGTVAKEVGPRGDRRDLKGVVPDVHRLTWKGRRVIIAFDADTEHNPQVCAARRSLTAVLIERGAVVGLLEWPIEEGKGIDDWIARVGPDPVMAVIASVQNSDWRKLLRNGAGKLSVLRECGADARKLAGLGRRAGPPPILQTARRF
jgi:hypothetical protein